MSDATRPLALVTGACGGIGAAISVELAVRGFDLALTDLHVRGGEALLAAIRAHGSRASLHVCDLARVEAHAALLRDVLAAHDSHTLACLVNNAGVPAAQRGDLLDVAPEAFDQVLGVNLRGTFFLTQAVARHMAGAACAAPRSIVTVSSVSAEMASVERGEYCISKAGLAMLNRLFALRLAALDIGVFEVRPGIVRSPMTGGVAAQYEQRIADGLVPMRRWGQPPDVARSVAALASGDFAFATGSIVQVDGGLSISRL